MQALYFYCGCTFASIAFICGLVLFVIACREGAIEDAFRDPFLWQLKFIIDYWHICKIPFLLQFLFAILAIICFVQME